MFFCGKWILNSLPLLLFLSYSAKGNLWASKTKPWMKNYANLNGQTWVALSRDHGRKSGALYSVGRLQNAHDSGVHCIDGSRKGSEKEDQNGNANGVICKLNPHNGREKWCARTCEDGVPLLSVVAPGKEVVYTAGVTNSKDSVLYTLEKNSGAQKMLTIIQGQVFKMKADSDGVYVCGDGTDEEGKRGLMIARITKAGRVKWLKILRKGGLENCLSLSAQKDGSAAYVVGITRSGSTKTGMYAMKVGGETGEAGWTSELTDRNYLLTSGDVIAKRGIYVTVLESDLKRKREHVLIHKLGEGTGILLWSKSGRDADGVYSSSLIGRLGLVYASWNNSGVRISSTASGSTDRLLGDVERENEIWVQRQDAITLEAVDTALGRREGAILWRTNEGGNLIQTVLYDSAPTSGSAANTITQVKSKLKLDLPTTAQETMKSGICDIVGDAMRGRALITNDMLMVTGRVTKYEAEMVIKKIMEDRDNDGRSQVEKRLGVRKRSVVLAGELVTMEARDIKDGPRRRESKKAILSGQDGAGGERSVVAEASQSKWWTWWKILVATVAGVGVVLVVWLVARRL